MSPVRAPAAPAIAATRRAATPRAAAVALAAMALAAMALAAMALAPAPLAAQGAGSGATTILRVAPGPVPLSLGNAWVAVRAPQAMEYNPAGLSGPGEVGASYQALPVGASAGSAILALPAGRLELGLSLRFLDYGTVDVIVPSGTLPVGERTGETATGGELSVLLGAAAPLGPVRLARPRAGSGRTWRGSPMTPWRWMSACWSGSPMPWTSARRSSTWGLRWRRAARRRCPGR